MDHGDKHPLELADAENTNRPIVAIPPNAELPGTTNPPVVATPPNAELPGTTNPPAVVTLPNAELPGATDAPVIVTLPNAELPGTTNVYVVRGPNGIPQLLVPAGVNLVAVRARQHQPTGAVEAGSVPVHGLTVSTRVNELSG
jgi:hypothetical protein